MKLNKLQHIPCVKISNGMRPYKVGEETPFEKAEITFNSFFSGNKIKNLVYVIGLAEGHTSTPSKEYHLYYGTDLDIETNQVFNEDSKDIANLLDYKPQQDSK